MLAVPFVKIMSSIFFQPAQSLKMILESFLGGIFLDDQLRLLKISLQTSRVLSPRREGTAPCVYVKAPHLQRQIDGGDPHWSNLSSHTLQPPAQKHTQIMSENVNISCFHSSILGFLGLHCNHRTLKTRITCCQTRQADKFCRVEMVLESYR